MLSGGGAEVPGWLSDRQPVERTDGGSAERQYRDGPADGAGGGVQVGYDNSAADSLWRNL